MKHVQALPKKRLLASALLLALTPAIQAAAQEQPAPASQTANPNADADPTDLDTVVVTGIRASLTSSMNLKRDAQGVVDGIVAEDIGKFPDTNLAEALQRISGVSIDRTSSGEGSKVTVRGISPDFNLVLLNGRQMPASNLGPGGAGTSNSRSFDFANLAAEAISAIEVHKTGRAELPTGGIGATINVKTARPLEIGEPLASVGFKAVHDTSARNLPQSFPGAIVTPEISGIFSQTYADGRFGIAISGSYQERESGFSQASVADGWITFAGDDTNSWNRLPLAGEPNYDRVTNRPGPDDIYSRPQNTGYSVNGVQRQRTNGQLTLQWAPSDKVTATMDYSYMENKVQQQRSELSVWFSQTPGDSSWTNGPVAAPIIYEEEYDGADLSMGGMQLATKNSGDSLGFNVEWEVNDALKLEFDYHNSKAESQPDSRLGSAGVLGVAAYVRGNTTVDYSGEIPIVNVQLPPGMTSVQAADALVTGSVFQNSYSRSEVEQFQADGRFEFGDYSGLDFGVAATEVNNRTASAVMQRDTWGGVGTPADYDDSIWHADNMSRYFRSFGNSGNPNWTDGFLVFDFERLRQAAIAVSGCPSCYEMPTEFTNDLRTTEKSKSAYLQWTTTFDWAIPLHVAAGVRYEETEISSPARVLTPASNGISWDSANELYVVLGNTPQEENFTGKYDYLLPNLDLRADLTENLVLRGSYSETIGRPGWMDIQGGQTINTLVRIEGGTGTLGNPGLLPLESKNFDLSLEWYYGESSYLSAGYFRKNVRNFISSTIVEDTPYNLHTPVGGAYWDDALANGGVDGNGCGAGDMICIRNYILRTYDGSPGVTATGVNSAGEYTGSIVGQPNDPIATFDITTPANQRADHVDGWEINFQHVFGDSGFGVAANYTKVDSGLRFDDTSLGTQYPMVGLSDTANVVAFYDKNAWQVRAAYNWRDEFFNGVGPRTDPNYVEAYGQLDAIISYEVLENLTLSLEGINLTDETQRLHARHENMVRYATQTGPRYMFGVRYRF